MNFLSITLIAGGIIAVAIGLPASQKCGRILGTLAALLVLAGVIASLIGALISAVPGFFNR